MSVDATQAEGEHNSHLAPSGASGGAPAIEIVTSLATGGNRKAKVIVAVHGIGDQLRAATVSSVATRFYRYMDKPAGIPLGRFHGDGDGQVSGAHFPKRVLPDGYGFAEIYWANVPREVATEGYSLEESKQWVRTIVARLQPLIPRDAKKTPTQIRTDNRLIVQILQEMIEGVAILDRLLFLARKAGIFDFSLNKLLNDFLNDVQIVAEFSFHRKKILEKFRDAMREMVKANPDAEIHVVAHSEGTVVAFLGILAGIKNANRATEGTGEHDREGIEADRKWTRNLKGLMTIGSPLNKHIVFWPELFDEHGAPEDAPAEDDRIRWRNYYDFGDPIGFDLGLTRKWMKEYNWDRFFEFNGPEDVADAATERADALLQATTDPGVVGRTPISGKAAELIKEARNLAEQANALARKCDVPADGPRKAAAVSPGNAEKYASKAKAKVAQAEAKIDLARQVDPRSALPPHVQAGPNKAVHDYGFTRYYFPGSAHNDYWTDDHVFGHFIQSVVDPDDELERRGDHDFRQPPATRPLARVTSYILPYVLSNVMLLIGVYVLYKTVLACIPQDLHKSDGVATVARNVIGLTFLINGMTVLSRIPVLSSHWKWRMFAIVFFVISAFAFNGVDYIGFPGVDKEIRASLGSFLIYSSMHVIPIASVGLVFLIVMGALSWDARNTAPDTKVSPILYLGGAGALVLIVLAIVTYFSPKTDDYLLHPEIATIVLVTLAAAFSVIAWQLSREYPSLGMKPLIYSGGAVILLIVWVTIASLRDKVGMAVNSEPNAPVWPVMLAFPAFLYLWWLSALIFDLAFFWHRYVRHAVGLRTLNEVVGSTSAS